MTGLLLIRHGESTWNAEQRWQGQQDPPLSETGRAQARLASERIGAVDAIFASPLARARETAAILANSIGLEPVIELPGLMERDAGAFGGLTRPEIEERFPGYLDEGRRPDDYEADESVAARAAVTIDAIRATVPDGDVLVVTHGGLIAQFTASLGDPQTRLANLGAVRLAERAGRLVVVERLSLAEVDEPAPSDRI